MISGLIKLVLYSIIFGLSALSYSDQVRIKPGQSIGDIASQVTSGFDNKPLASVEARVKALQMQEQPLKMQLSAIEQQIHALQLFIIAQNALKLHWKDFKNGEVSKNSLLVDLGKNKKQSICRAEFQHGTHPGIIKNCGCLITYGGDVLIIDHYQVLTGRTPTEWRNLDKDQVIKYQMVANNTDQNLWQSQSIPIQGGFSDTPAFANNTALFICKADYNNGGVSRQAR